MMNTAILIVNMGGPLSTAEVKPYLRAIFADPMILPMPGAVRKMVGELIVARRTKKVQDRYDLIGGGSPLLRWTQRQAELIAQQQDTDSQQVEYAFRYTSPDIGEAIDNLANDGVQRIYLLPLFPHSTRAMTGSIQIEATRHAARYGVELRTVPAWGLHPEIVELQQLYLANAMKKAGEDARVLFVAHGIPIRDVERGDDYPDQVLRNAERIAESLPSGTDWSLAYQSRVGPVKWTQPYLEDELDRLSKSADPIVLMPLSFVADCLETLYDLDHVTVPELQARGVREVVRVPAFNDDPRFAKALSRVIAEVYHD